MPCSVLRYNPAMTFEGMNKSQRTILITGLAVFLFGLGTFAFLGQYFRYWADDWCYNADFKNLGFLETLRGYSYNVTYTPSRYSVTILAGLFYPLGVVGLQLLVPVTLLLWTMGLVRLFKSMSSLSGHPLTTAQAILVSAVIVYFSIYLAPHVYQSVYWNTGLFTYTFPLALMPWVLVGVTDQNHFEKPSTLLLVLVALLALLAGGFSEASCTVLVSVLALYTFVAGIGYWRKKAWAQRTLLTSLVGLIFALTAMALLIFAPTTQIRSERYGEPAGLSELAVLVFNFTRAFFVLSVKDYQQPLLFVITGLFGFLLNSTSGRPVSVPKTLGLGFGIFGLAFLLVAASFTPSAYVERGLPILRTHIIPRHIMVLAFVSAGWIAGYALRSLYAPKWLDVVAVPVLLIALAYPVYTIMNVSENIPVYRERAQLWDERDEIIRSAIADDAERVEVQAIDGFLVGGIRDFDPPDKKGYWISVCAMDYYRIKFQVTLP